VKILFAIAFLSAAFSIVSAQATGRDGTAGKSLVQMKSQVSNFKNARRFKIGYDKFSDLTDVFFTGFITKAGVVGMEFSYNGDTLKGSITQFKLNFESSLYNRDNGDNTLDLIIDGAREHFSSGQRHTVQMGYGLLGGEVTTLSFDVDADFIKKLAEAKSVEFRLGGYAQDKLKAEHQQMMKDMLALASIP
jgi:hypothetical protein